MRRKLIHAKLLQQLDPFPAAPDVFRHFCPPAGFQASDGDPEKLIQPAERFQHRMSPKGRPVSLTARLKIAEEALPPDQRSHRLHRGPFHPFSSEVPGGKQIRQQLLTKFLIRIGAPRDRRRQPQPDLTHAGHRNGKGVEALFLRHRAEFIIQTNQERSVCSIHAVEQAGPAPVRHLYHITRGCRWFRRCVA